MDRKTLEYMENRATKARLIVNTIDRLKENIENMNVVKTIHFMNSAYRKEFDSSVGNLTVRMKDAYIKAATNEIEELEKALAEL